MKYILLLLIVAFIPLSLGSSYVDYSIGTKPILTLPCTDYDGLGCNSSISCNITIIQYPNGSLYLENQTATFNTTGFFKYNIADNLTDLGDYPCMYYCYDLNGNNGTDTCTFAMAEQIGWKIAIIIGMIIISFILLFLGLMFEQGQWLVKNSLFISSLLVGIIFINSSRLLAQDANSSKVLDTTLIISIIAISLMFLYLFIHTMIQIFNAVKDSRKEKETNHEKAD